MEVAMTLSQSRMSCCWDGPLSRCLAPTLGTRSAWPNWQHSRSSGHLQIVAIYVSCCCFIFHVLSVWNLSHQSLTLIGAKCYGLFQPCHPLVLFRDFFRDISHVIFGDACKFSRHVCSSCVAWIFCYSLRCLFSATRSNNVTFCNVISGVSSSSVHLTFLQPF